MAQKCVFVCGGTGKQGGAVVRGLLSGGHFKVRALTRDANKEKAEELKKLGAEVVEGDMDDLSSIEQHLKGCDAMFLVANIWEVGYDKEVKESKEMADLCKKLRIKHLIYSGLESAKPFNVPHFEGKHESEEYIKGLGINYTFVHMAFYFENFLDFTPPHEESDGSLVFSIPTQDNRLGMVAVEDLGPIVNIILERGPEFYGKTQAIAGDWITMGELCKTASNILGRPVRNKNLSPEDFAKQDMPGAEEMAEMFKHLIKEQPFQGVPEECRRLYPGMHNFESWLKTHAPSNWRKSTLSA